MISNLSFGKICLTILDLSVSNLPCFLTSSIDKSFRTFSKAILQTCVSRCYLTFWEEVCEVCWVKCSYLYTRVTRNLARNSAPEELKTGPFCCSEFW